MPGQCTDPVGQRPRHCPHSGTAVLQQAPTLPVLSAHLYFFMAINIFYLFIHYPLYFKDLKV